MSGTPQQLNGGLRPCFIGTPSRGERLIKASCTKVGTISRRHLLKRAAMLPVLPALAAVPAACGPRRRHYTPAGIPLRRVLVSDARVIRRIAGLRPFRASGFVVRAESFDDKLVIHNYGHGGGGITLSPGTSWLAAELAQQSPESLKPPQTSTAAPSASDATTVATATTASPNGTAATTTAATTAPQTAPTTARRRSGSNRSRSEPRRCAVIGAGAVGLATARLMQDRGWQVSIYSRDLPPNTTSNVAGGQWSPTSVFDEDYLTPEFEAQFDAAQRFAFRYYQNLVGPRYGVSWISNYQVHDKVPEPDPIRSRYADLYPKTELLGPGEHPFPVRYARHFYTMLIDPGIYLPQMLEDFRHAGGQLHIMTFADRDHVLSLNEPLIFNCTGLGSRSLFGDTELIPVKGQLTFLLPQPEVEYLIIGNGGLYMFPRRDGILLGGTFEREEWSIEPDPVEDRRILDGHRDFFNKMDDPWGRSMRG